MNKILKIAGTAWPLAENPLAIYLASLSPSGRRSIAGRLKYVSNLLGYDNPEIVPWHELRFQHVAAIRTKIQESGKAPATVNATIYALRGVARASFNLGQMTADDYQRLRDVRPIKADRLPAGRSLTSGEISAMINTCMDDDSPSGVRDAALIAVMYCAGLRRAEAVSLRLGNSAITGDKGELRVKGKGNKERLVYVDNGATEALKDWLSIRGNEPGPLFLPVNKGGKVGTQKMTEQAIYNMLRRRAEQAKVKSFSPHDLRRSFVSDLLDAGADITTVQKLAGHANIQTTAKYDRRGEEAKRKAVSLLHVPYRKR